MIVTTPDRFDTCYQKQVSIAYVLLVCHVSLRLWIVFTLCCGDNAVPAVLLLRRAWCHNTACIKYN